jgi:asparagine N-glycosylation enzyme membrane subunit Stt3
MKKITRAANTIVVLSMLTFLAATTAAKTAITGRLERIDNDRGDVPGWAIASGAACVLAALVYTAYSNVINKWIKRIS